MINRDIYKNIKIKTYGVILSVDNGDGTILDQCCRLYNVI